MWCIYIYVKRRCSPLADFGPSVRVSGELRELPDPGSVGQGSSPVDDSRFLSSATTHSRANAATPKRDDTPEDASVDVDAYLRHHVLKWEYSLYDRVYRRFRDQKRACNLAATKPRPKSADV